MSILDRIFVGNIIKDFGTVKEQIFGIGKLRQSALLIEKHGRLFFVIKMTIWGLFGASFNYQSFALKDAIRVRDFISESERIAQNMPPSTYNFSRAAIRNMLIALIIASTINLLASNEGLVFIVTLIATFVQVVQFFTFRSDPDVDPQTRISLFFIMLFTFIIGALKFFWLLYAGQAK